MRKNSKLLNNTDYITPIYPTPQLHRVLVKWYENPDEKQSVLFFDAPVHIVHDAVNKIISVVDDKNQCLFLTHKSNITFIQVAADMPVEPFFLNRLEESE